MTHSWSALQPVDRLESGADRQRRIYRDAGDWHAAVDDLIQQLADELSPASAPQAGVLAAVGG